MERTEDERWMEESLTLAEKGVGFVSPNPLVGAVIVKHGKVLGKGYHRRFGEAHAEAAAINEATQNHRDVEGATLYVNLEPCVHFGKTPPCVDAIITHKIGRVVAAMEDPNPLMAGKGFRKLAHSGVEVTAGVCEREARLLNQKFVKFVTSHVPFVALKAAQTYDGFIAKDGGLPRWISSPESRKLVHRLRTQFDAVLVGAGTIIMDNPRLTVRHVRGRNPFRIIVDGALRSPVNSRVFNDGEKTLLYIADSVARKKRLKVRQLEDKGVLVRPMEGNNGILFLKDILNDLAHRNIASVLVEGGQFTYARFLQARLVDRIFLFTSPRRFGAGLSTFGRLITQFSFSNPSERFVGPDYLIEGDVAFL